MPMNLQSKVVKMSSRYIQKIDATILIVKEEYIEIVSSKKRKVQTLVPLQNVFSAHQYHLLLWHMAGKRVIYVIGNYCTVSSRIYVFACFETT